MSDVTLIAVLFAVCFLVWTFWRRRPLSEITPKILSVSRSDPERMSANELRVYTRHLQENKQETDRFKIAFWKKLFDPLAAVRRPGNGTGLGLATSQDFMKQLGTQIRVESAENAGTTFSVSLPRVPANGGEVNPG